jgi:hypothetical protein
MLVHSVAKRLVPPRQAMEERRSQCAIRRGRGALRKKLTRPCGGWEATRWWSYSDWRVAPTPVYRTRLPRCERCPAPTSGGLARQFLQGPVQRGLHDTNTYRQHLINHAASTFFQIYVFFLHKKIGVQEQFCVSRWIRISRVIQAHFEFQNSKTDLQF